MSTENKKEKENKKQDEKKGEYLPPKGLKNDFELRLSKTQTLKYSAEADWIVLKKEEKPVAEMFFTSYHKKKLTAHRPLTFVFNGGPGAASAYLYVGAMGPKRVQFNKDGSAPKPPAKLIDNSETWLQFTDLVFVDPVGTGFSRTIEKGEGAPASDKDKGAKNKEFYQTNRDLESLGEFIQKFLSKYKRWSSPIFIAGESYGGFRAAKLARKLQEGYGVGINGTVLISPALEISLLDSSDYDILPWVHCFPAMAAAAHYHGKSTACKKGAPLRKVLSEAQKFATGELAAFLAVGDEMEEDRRQKIISQMSHYLGVPETYLEEKGGRLRPPNFCRTLLKNERKYLGIYDASVSSIDPFPDRDVFEGPDPTLFSIERLFSASVNIQLREIIGLETTRDYHLLSWNVNKSWSIEADKSHALEAHMGATDDLRYGMCLNPNMKVFLAHGYYDLVTPYFASNRISKLMKLDKSLQDNLQIKHFEGGHMFYLWEKSRKAFVKDIEQFYRAAL